VTRAVAALAELDIFTRLESLGAWRELRKLRVLALLEGDARALFFVMTGALISVLTAPVEATG